PNDIVVRSDDSIWFTDPVYGITSNYSGIIDTRELPTNVYRLDKNGRATVVAGDINRPDGLAFSPDETKLYVIEDGVTPQGFRRSRLFMAASHCVYALFLRTQGAAGG